MNSRSATSRRGQFEGGGSGSQAEPQGVSRGTEEQGAGAQRMPGQGPECGMQRYWHWLACRTCRDGNVLELLTYIDSLLAIGQESAAAHPDVPFAIMPATLLAMVVAGTPEAGLPSVAV